MRRAFRILVSGLLGLTVLAIGAVPIKAAGWNGEFSVYTKASFSYQHLDYTCVGASVQMMLNMIDGTAHHSAAAQRTYWQYGRDHSEHLSSNDGVDPVGWVAALEHFGAGNYSISLSTRFQGELRQLATAMRATDKPVGLFVDAGNHAWVMTGFAATADPATTSNFMVTAVQAMGPLFPDGTINGKPYDPGPGTWLNLDLLGKKFSPMRWRAAPEWNGRWVAVSPN